MTAPSCHPDRPHKAKGLCKPCWTKTRTGAPAATSIPAKVRVASTEDSPKPAKVAARSASYAGLRCPEDPAHGLLLPSKEPGGGWFCPHAAHDGRLHGHPAGPAPRTRSAFTTAEAESGQVAL